MTIAGPHLDAAALTAAVRRTVPGAQITLRSRLLAAISGAPLPHGGFVTFAQGTAAAAAFSLLILVLTLVLGARSRELTLARLVTMGLAPSQSRRITAVEILPLILAAAVGGTVCALALVPLVGPAINLSAFTGTPVTVPLRAQPWPSWPPRPGCCCWPALTLIIQARLARSRGASPGPAGRASDRAGGEAGMTTAASGQARRARRPGGSGSASSAPRRSRRGPPTARAR